jgi:hypothetical protein
MKVASALAEEHWKAEHAAKAASTFLKTPGKIKVASALAEEILSAAAFRPHPLNSAAKAPS